VLGVEVGDALFGHHVALTDKLAQRLNRVPHLVQILGELLGQRDDLGGVTGLCVHTFGRLELLAAQGLHRRAEGCVVLLDLLERLLLSLLALGAELGRLSAQRGLLLGLRVGFVVFGVVLIIGEAEVRGAHSRRARLLQPARLPLLVSSLVLVAHALVVHLLVAVEVGLLAALDAQAVVLFLFLLVGGRIVLTAALDALGGELLLLRLHRADQRRLVLVLV